MWNFLKRQDLEAKAAEFEAKAKTLSTEVETFKATIQDLTAKLEAVNSNKPKLSNEDIEKLLSDNDNLAKEITELKSKSVKAEELASVKAQEIVAQVGVTNPIPVADSKQNTTVENKFKFKTEYSIIHNNNQ